MATKGSSKLYAISDLWSGLEDIRDQVNQQSIRLFRLLQLESSNLLAPLVLELLEHYNCDLNTFIFNGHSFAITLEDIMYITGLPIQGIPIMDASKDKNAFSIFDKNFCKRSCPISKLKDHAKDTRVDPITRMKAALLVLIACFVIPTGDEHQINRNFVKYVDKLDEVDNYAWGAALLAFLHDGISKWKKEQKSLINGNLWVVLSVFLIRIRSLREAIHIKLDLENAEVPLLHSVVNAVKNISHNHKPKYLDKVKEALDNLSEEEINWVPYKHLQLRLPGILKEQERYKLLVSPICCMDSIVHHRPHLAAKQFEELKHLDLSKLTWQKTDLVSKQNRGFFAEKLSSIVLAQWNAGKLVTDFLPGYEEEGLSRHNEETSISRDAEALEYEFRKMPLDTNMQIIHSPCQNGANETTSQPSDAAFAYENAHHSIPEESRHIKSYKRHRGSNVEKEKKNMPVVDNKEKKCGKKKEITSSKENEVAQEAMRQDNNEDKDEISKADVTTRYAKLWKTSASSTKCRDPKLVGTVTFGKPCDHASKTRNNDNTVVGDVPSDSIPVPSKNSGFIHSVAPSSSPPKQNTLTPLISVVEDCNHVLEDVQLKDKDKSIEARLSSDKILDNGSKPSKGDNIVDNVPSGFTLSYNSVEDSLDADDCRQVLEDVKFEDDANENQEALLSKDEIGESGTKEGSYSDLCKVIAEELEQRIFRLERVHRKLKMAKLESLLAHRS